MLTHTCRLNYSCSRSKHWALLSAWSTPNSKAIIAFLPLALEWSSKDSFLFVSLLLIFSSMWSYPVFCILHSTAELLICLSETCFWLNQVIARSAQLWDRAKTLFYAHCFRPPHLRRFSKLTYKYVLDAGLHEKTAQVFFIFRADRRVEYAL